MLAGNLYAEGNEVTAQDRRRETCSPGYLDWLSLPL